jgi:dihydrofolate reductase
LRKLVYCVASTIDGKIAGPDGADPTSWWPIPEDYLAHLIAELPEILPAAARDAFGVTAEGTHFDTVLEGRHTYEIGTKAGVHNAYPHLRHLVFSTSLLEVQDPKVELVATDPVEKVRELKQEDGKDIWLCGGARLAGTLYDEIDRLIVKLGPLTTGAGIPFLSADFKPVTWRLTRHHALDSGALFLTYDRA